MISKIKLSPDLKIIERENTSWTQGDETNNIYLYVPDETIQLVELFVTKPGGMVNIDTVKFIKGFDEEGNSVWLAPNGIPSKLFQFTIYTGLTAQATFSFKLHSGINILDIKYKTTINTIWTINKSDAAITQNDETNETQQWRAIGSLSNDIVEQRNDFNVHLADNVPDEVTPEDPDVHGVRDALDRLSVEVTAAANAYTDQEIEVLDGDLTFYIDTLDQNMDAKKVDKSTALPGEDVLYTRTGANVETVTPVKVNTIEDGVVPKYDSTGTLSANNPTINTHVVNKQTMESNIEDHNTGLTTHQDLRNLISDLNAEIDRLDGKGRSYGEIAATQSVLLGLSQSARNANINNDIASRFPGYTPANGDLIYTNEDSEQNIENSHEWEYNSPTWVDNGAYTVQKASNSTFGLVKGGNSYISIAAGIVSVLLSDYATRIGTSSGNFTYANLEALFNDRYTKSQVDSLLDNLKAIYGWTESELVEITGSGAKTIDKTLFADYDFVLLNHYNDTKSDSFLIKPDDMLNGRVWESNISHVTFTSTELTFTSTANDVLIATGIKMTPIDAKDVTYLSVTSESTTVKAALDELYSPTYVTGVYDDLTNTVTATDNFNLKDESGQIIRIEGGAEPENMITSPDPTVPLTFTKYDNYVYDPIDWIAGNKYYLSMTQRVTADVPLYWNSGAVGYTLLHDVNGSQILLPYNYTLFSDGQFHTRSVTFDSENTWTKSILVYNANSTSAPGAELTVKDAVVIDISNLIKQGVKNDNGVLFSNLSNEEITEQMDIWVENGFPTTVEKIISKSDNLFDAEFKPLTNLDSEAIMVNGTIPAGLTTDDLYYTESDEHKYVSRHYYAAGKNLAGPDLTGKTYLGDGVYRIYSASNRYWDYNVYNGKNVIKSTAGGSGEIYTFNVPLGTYTITVESNNKEQSFYLGTNLGAFYANHLYGDKKTIFTFDNVSSITVNLYESGDLITEFTLQIEESPVATTYEPYVMPKKIVNLSDLIADDILPAGLDNNTYLNMIVNKNMDRLPLRESNPIAVEPNGTYKIIKASSIPSTHKLVEYTNSNELVKVTDIVYTNKKSQVLTMDSTTGKVKIVSDLLERVPSLTSRYPDDNTIHSSNAYYVSLDPMITFVQGNEYFTRIETKQITNVYNVYSGMIASWSPDYYLIGGQFQSVLSDGKWHVISSVTTAPVTTSGVYIYSAHQADPETREIYFKNFAIYNITDFKNKGVRDDNGTLFSRLTSDEINSQMNIWYDKGFPDHVVYALYPNGTDTAIAFKYNDSDDEFRALETDEMRINLTLRSGEYWENGYVIKQNGNADYFPLANTISAWNYGQLEAVYTSGIPANFSIKYPLNTSAQTESTSEYLKEARQQLDYVTNGYNDLVDQLGALIDEDGYNSFVGITSEKFDYYNLDGVNAGDTLKIVGTGQSVQNLLPSSAVVPNFTQDGLTVSYDPNNGIFTIDGTFTGSTAKNFTLAENIDSSLPAGTEMQLMRYYVDGTIDLKDSYVGYLLQGSTVNHRINENSESLYDPYINAAGSLSTDNSTYGQRILFQVWSPGMVFNNFQFKLGIYEGLKLQPYVIPGGEPAKTNVTVYNRNENALNIPNSFDIGDESSDIYISYDNLSQEFLVTGTATSTRDISLTATFSATVGERFSIKRVYQAGDVKDAGNVLPVIKLVDTSNNSVVENTIYERIPDTEEINLPTDITFNTGSAPDAGTLTLKLGVISGQQFKNYRFRLMIHDNATDIGYVPFERHTIGTMIVGKDETAELEFDAINYGILEFVAQSETLNLLFGSTLGDLSKSMLEYNSGIASPTRKITELNERVTLIDETYKDKVIAIWGDSRESNNPTSDPSGVGDQLDTSWPALLAKKTGATVLNYGLSGGCWTENTVQQDAAAAIVNRISTQDVSASADVIIISVMNDFKLASPLGSPLPSNKDKTTFYGAMRATYETLAAKYPGKKIYLVLPQKRYDEDANYGGGSYYHYLKAQVEVANEYGIPVVDLYNNMPGVKNTSFYTTYMLNDTHWNAAGNERVAELVMRTLLGNGNKGNMDRIPSIPQTDGTYTLQVTIANGVPTFTWISNT